MFVNFGDEFTLSVWSHFPLILAMHILVPPFPQAGWPPWLSTKTSSTFLVFSYSISLFYTVLISLPCLSKFFPFFKVHPKPCLQETFPHYLFFKILTRGCVYWFSEKEEGREGEKEGRRERERRGERDISVWEKQRLAASHTCPDRGWNLQPSGSQDNTPSWCGQASLITSVLTDFSLFWTSYPWFSISYTQIRCPIHSFIFN